MIWRISVLLTLILFTAGCVMLGTGHNDYGPAGGACIMLSMAVAALGRLLGFIVQGK